MNWRKFARTFGFSQSWSTSFVISEEQLAALVDRQRGSGGEKPIAAGPARVLDQHIAKVAKLKRDVSKTAH
jgi:hypothetical protein